MNRIALLIALLCLAGLPALADDVYVGTSTGEFGVFNTTTDSFTLIGTNSSPIYGLGLSGGTLYATNNGSSPSTTFYSVNTTTGVFSSIGDLTGSTGGTGALTAPVGGGTLYYFDHSNQLFTINPANGAATVVGPLGFSLGGSWDITFAQNGNLYVTTNGYFGEINPSTGLGSEIGYNGIQMQGLVAADGGVYGFSGNEMYSINLTTGAATFLMDTPSGIGNIETGTEVPSAVTTPEPGSLLSLLLGLALLGAFALRYRPQFSRAV